MAHIKCHYTKYICTYDFGGKEECAKNGWYCNWNPREDEQSICRFLGSYPCYYEKVSKSVEFDGDALIVGGKFVACLPSADYEQEPDDSIIDSLEIDGKLIISDGHYALEKEDKEGEAL